VVRVVRRPVAAGESAIRWDPAEGRLEPADLEGVDAVVHLAGAGIGDRRWNADRKREIVESRTKSTALLARTIAAMDRRPRALVSGSAIGYYGDRGDKQVTESTDHGSDFLATLCARWEGETAAASEAGVRVAIARSGLVLSARGGALPKLLPLFRLGLGGRFGSGWQWWSWISIDDEVSSLLWILDHEVAGPFNLAAPNPVTNREFARTLARTLSRPALLPVPRFGPGLLMGRELAGTLLFTSARVYPEALMGAGYTFQHENLEGALEAVLGRRA
jgi:uncharacterized protein (TIGR01777 family)